MGVILYFGSRVEEEAREIIGEEGVRFIEQFIAKAKFEEVDRSRVRGYFGAIYGEICSGSWSRCWGNNGRSDQSKIWSVSQLIDHSNNRRGQRTGHHKGNRFHFRG